MKVVPCVTQQQAALLDREAANLRAMQQQTQQGRQVTAPYAPALLDVFRQTANGQGMLAMRSVCQGMPGLKVLGPWMLLWTHSTPAMWCPVHATWFSGGDGCQQSFIAACHPG